MASYNKVLLIGNLTRDPEIRYTTGGMAVTDLGLAVNRYWTDKGSNERREETTFVDVTLWGRQAEIAGEYLAKGRPVLIEGRLHLDQWEDRESGQKRSKLKVVGESMQLLGSRGEGGASPAAASGTSTGGTSRPTVSPAGGARRPPGGTSAGLSEDDGGYSGGRTPDQTFYDDMPSSSGDDVPF
jgi:single-strand DNA-binding protein